MKRKRQKRKDNMKLKIETKKSETAIAEAKIKSEYELSKLVEQNRHKEAMQNQQKQFELKIKEEQTRCELNKQAKQLEHEATMQEKQHKHELAMQAQRYEEKRLELEMLSYEAEILEQNGEKWLDLKCLETELKSRLLKGERSIENKLQLYLHIHYNYRIVSQVKEFRKANSKLRHAITTFSKLLVHNTCMYIRSYIIMLSYDHAD